MASGLFVFSSDLRLQDNLALIRAASSCSRLALLFIVDPSEKRQTQYQCAQIGDNRQVFIHQALCDLKDQLAALDHDLIILSGEKQQVINKVLAVANIDRIYYSQTSDMQSQKEWDVLQKNIPNVQWHGVWQHTLFSTEQFPFELKNLPDSFSKFRRKIEKDLPVIDKPQQLLSLPARIESLDVLNQSNVLKPKSSLFEGGSSAGQLHLTAYFESSLPQHYKETRNALDDWPSSTKFSPWLANGCLSARQIYQALQQHEQKHGSNESTYWIFFELLWREYFHWSALKIGKKLFEFGGISNNKPLASFHGERFLKWQQGLTPYPLINAIMHQLNETGFISNRARQITASCLVNEFSVDWRYGAAYFQEQLLDYDAASNWGNWQYIAGVGVDPRGGRHFNIEKQAQLFDSDGQFVKRWQGTQSCCELDSIAIDDWPIAK